MLSGISITCFAASYALAWLLELWRVWRRTRLGGRALVLAAGGAGLFAQTLFLWHRAATTASPLSSWFDWYLLAAWVLAALYLYLAWFHPENALGLFVLPCVLCLVGVATLTASRDPFPRAQAAHVWGWVHGVFLLLGCVAVLCGF